MIGVCGYGCTGSGAVLDLLKEYEDVVVVDGKEFDLTYFPGGLEDLEFHLMKQKAKFYSSDIGIKMFLKYMKAICHSKKSYYNKLTNNNFQSIVNNYISSITQIQWDGRWNYDDYIFDSYIQKILFFITKRIRFLEKKSRRNMRLSINPDSFYEKTNEFLKKIYNFEDLNYTFVLDQAFPANNPINSMKLFGNDSKAIILLRDPRDVYLNNIKNKERWIPLNDLNDYIRFFKALYSSRFENQNILYIYFEDLIYNYEKTVKKISDFCNISETKHTRKLQKFNPNVSIKNTRLFINNPKYKKEIEIIEKEMKEYLYDYSKVNINIDKMC